MANGIRVVGEVQVPACLRPAKWSSSLRRSLSVTSSSTLMVLEKSCYCTATVVPRNWADMIPTLPERVVDGLERSRARFWVLQCAVVRSSVVVSSVG